MADTKISALPAVAVPAVGDEFACNQAGVTKKETKAQITAATDANLTAHAAVTAAGVHGSSVLTANDTLVHRSAAGLAHAVAFRADAGAIGAPGFTFTADPNTGHYNYAADELGIATGGAHRAHWNTTGAVILNNAAASTFMTGPGVTIQQGAFDDEAIALKSTDVAHGITGYADTDTYFAVGKTQPTSGGAELSGFKDADDDPQGALVLKGYLGENVDTTKTVNGVAIVNVVGYIKSGAGIGDTNADGNVFAIRTRRGGSEVTLLIVDEDGDLWLNGTLTANEIADRTRKFFISAVGGQDFTAGDPLEISFSQGFTLIDNANCKCWGFGIVPNDFVSGMTITPVLVPDANGNCYGRMRVEYGQCTENYVIHSDDSGVLSAVAVTANDNNCIHQVTLANEAAGDILRCNYQRDAANVLDTVNTSVYIAGFIVEYTADS